MSRVFFRVPDGPRHAAWAARCHPWLLVLALLLHAGVADAGRLFVEVGNGRGLDATVVPTLLVDRDGLLWVGPREGRCTRLRTPVIPARRR